MVKTKNVLVDVYLKQLVCSCGGFMSLTGGQRVVEEEKQVLVEHRCQECGELQEVINAQYPQIEYLNRPSDDITDESDDITDEKQVASNDEI